MTDSAGHEDRQPSGLLIQKDIPDTAEAVREEAQKLGVKLGKASPFGFRPGVDRSAPVPVTDAGDSIVDAADGLRKRRRGEVSLNGRVATKQGQALIARAIAARRARHAG